MSTVCRNFLRWFFSAPIVGPRRLLRFGRGHDCHRSRDREFFNWGCHPFDVALVDEPITFKKPYECDMRQTSLSLNAYTEDSFLRLVMLSLQKSTGFLFDIDRAIVAFLILDLIQCPSHIPAISLGTELTQNTLSIYRCPLPHKPA